MGKYDDAMYRYMKEPERFTELINVAVFNGKRVLKPEMLESDDGRYVTMKKSRKGKLHSSNRFRDIKKRTKDGVFFALTAIENQEAVDYTMPWRMMQYDQMEYEEQMRQIRKQKEVELLAQGIEPNKWNVLIGENDKLYPTYSVCFYHGTELWNGPRRLRDMMNFSEAGCDWVEHFQDYGMNLFCANEVTDYSMFQTGLKQLLQVIPYRKNKKKLCEVFKKEEFRVLDQDTAEVIAIMTDTTEILERLDNYEVKGGYDMCQAMDELRADWRAEGKAEGKAETLLNSIRNIMKTMELTANQAMGALLIPEEDRENYFAKL